MTARLAETVAAERSRVLGWRDKAVQPEWYGATTAEVAAMATPLDLLSTPMMTLDRRAIGENSRSMLQWCSSLKLSLAPHGKTTMAPSLWQEQLNAGCWGITVANEPQLRVAVGAGVSCIILANLFLRPEGLRWLSRELENDDQMTVYCWVDSAESVAQMDTALRAAGASQPVPVFVEVGQAGSRTGARSIREAVAIAQAVNRTRTLALAGVSGFEGAVAHEVSGPGLAAVDEFLRRMVDVHHEFLDRYEVPEPILTAGGSAFFDLVAAALSPEAANTRTRVVLRSGAYIVHDDGYYRTVTPHTRGAGPAFQSAMHVWTRVISMPEEGSAYLDAGKRDFPFDDALPSPQLLRRRAKDGRISAVPLFNHTVDRTYDQHARVRVPDGSPLRVGDVVRLGLSHPCTAFDKWSLIPILDDSSASSPVVVDLIRTYF